MQNNSKYYLIANGNYLIKILIQLIKNQWGQPTNISSKYLLKD